ELGPVEEKCSASKLASARQWASMWVSSSWHGQPSRHLWPRTSEVTSTAIPRTQMSLPDDRSLTLSLRATFGDRRRWLRARCCTDHQATQMTHPGWTSNRRG